MQNTIQNMMDEFMKNVSSFQPQNLSNSTDLFQDMGNSKIGLQLLDFQKSAFNNSYNTIVKIQEQSEKIADTFLKENSAVPAEGKKLINEWRGVVKKGQTEFKKSVDDSFKKAEAMLADATKATKTS